MAGEVSPEIADLIAAGEDLAHEVYRHFRGIEPAAYKRNCLRGALESYQRARARLLAHNVTDAETTARSR